MASPDEKRYPTNYWNLVGFVVFIWISFFVVVVQALHDDTRGETTTDISLRQEPMINEPLKESHDSTDLATTSTDSAYLPRSPQTSETRLLNESSKKSPPTSAAEDVEKRKVADWTLYRPRTRAAMRKLSCTETIIISSDSEASDAEILDNVIAEDLAKEEPLVAKDEPLEDLTPISVAKISEAGVIDQLASSEKIPSVESEISPANGSSDSQKSAGLETLIREDENKLNDFQYDDVEEKTETMEEALVDATHIDEEMLPDIIQASESVAKISEAGVIDQLASSGKIPSVESEISPANGSSDSQKSEGLETLIREDENKLNDFQYDDVEEKTETMEEALVDATHIDEEMLPDIIQASESVAKIFEAGVIDQLASSEKIPSVESEISPANGSSDSQKSAGLETLIREDENKLNDFQYDDVEEKTETMEEALVDATHIDEEMLPDIIQASESVAKISEAGVIDQLASSGKIPSVESEISPANGSSDSQKSEGLETLIREDENKLNDFQYDDVEEKTETMEEALVDATYIDEEMLPDIIQASESVAKISEAGVIDQLAPSEKIPSIESEISPANGSSDSQKSAGLETLIHEDEIKLNNFQYDDVEEKTETMEEALVDATHIDEEILPDIIQASDLRVEFSPCTFDEDTDVPMSIHRIVEGLDHSEDGDESCANYLNDKENSNSANKILSVDKDQCDQQQSITNSTKSKIVFKEYDGMNAFNFDNKPFFIKRSWSDDELFIRKKSADVQLKNDEFREMLRSNLRPLQQNVQQEQSTENISSENVISLPAKDVLVIGLPAKEVLVLPDLEEDKVSDEGHALASTKVTSSNEILIAEQLDGNIKNNNNNDATKLEEDPQVVLPSKSNKRSTSDSENDLPIMKRKRMKIGTTTVSESDVYGRKSSRKVKAIRNAISSEQKSVADYKDSVRVTKTKKCEQGVAMKKLKAPQQVGGLFSRLREQCKNIRPNFLRKRVFPDKQKMTTAGAFTVTKCPENEL